MLFPSNMYGVHRHIFSVIYIFLSNDRYRITDYCFQDFRFKNAGGQASFESSTCLALGSKQCGESKN